MVVFVFGNNQGMHLEDDGLKKEPNGDINRGTMAGLTEIV